MANISILLSNYVYCGIRGYNIILEFIEDKKPEAVIEIDDTVNIDITRFIEDKIIVLFKINIFYNIFNLG